MNGPVAKDTVNHHCSVVAIAGAGVLIEGAAGSGKTSLALGLIDLAKARGLGAALVCDDQALLSSEAGQIVASAPPTIAGLAELRFYGVTKVDHVDACKVALVGRIAEDDTLARMPEPHIRRLLDVDLEAIWLPRRHEQQAARIIFAWLGDHGWLTGSPDGVSAQR